MPIESSEISCDACPSVCCRDVKLPLSIAERDQLVEAGTQVTTILPPIRSRVTGRWLKWSNYPGMLRSELAKVASDAKAVDHLVDDVKRFRRGQGFYQIDGKCGNLDEDTGQCTDYENRPAICRDFPVAGFYCKLLREKRLVSVELISKPIADSPSVEG